MTKDEIMNMPAGREMDEAIAKCIMDIDVSIAGGNGGLYSWVKHYSTNLLAAFEVVDKMHKNEYQYTLRGHYMGVKQHIATFDHQDWADANPLYKAHGNTAAHAICRAALLATL